MTLGFLFWLLMVLWFMFNIWWGFRPNVDRVHVGGSFIVFILFFIIGWKLFGFVVTP